MSIKTRSSFIISVLCLGIISIVLGAAFIGMGVMKSQVMAQELKSEEVTYKINGEVVTIDSAEKAAAMASILKEHRQTIAPTYSALLNGGKYNPTDPKQLTYSQAINMENSLNLAQVGFGLTTFVEAVGVAMIIMGIGFVLVAIYLRRDGVFRQAAHA